MSRRAPALMDGGGAASVRPVRPRGSFALRLDGMILKARGSHRSLIGLIASHASINAVARVLIAQYDASYESQVVFEHLVQKESVDAAAFGTRL